MNADLVGIKRYHLKGIKMAGQFDLAIDVGASYGRQFEFATEADDGTRTPWDLTGVTASLVVRSSDRTWYDTYELPIVDNKVVLAFTPEHTSRFVVHRTFYYWLDLTFPGGTVRRELWGHLRAHPSSLNAGGGYA